MAERHPMEAPVLIDVQLIDVAQHAVAMFGREAAVEMLPPGTPFREHDYRFEVTTPTGGRCCFNYQATAADIAAWLAREVNDRG